MAKSFSYAVKRVKGRDSAIRSSEVADHGDAIRGVAISLRCLYSQILLVDEALSYTRSCHHFTRLPQKQNFHVYFHEYHHYLGLKKPIKHLV